MEAQLQHPLRNAPETWMDEIVDVYLKDVDRSMIRENLKLSVEQRIRNLEEAQRGVEAVQRAMRKAQKPE